MLPKPGLSSLHLGGFAGCIAQATDYEVLPGVSELMSQTAIVRLMLKLPKENLYKSALIWSHNSLEEVYMFHKILVAIDTSASAKNVFDEALFLAKASKASLMLLHVLSGEEQGRVNIPILPRQDYYPYPVMSKKTLEFNQKQWEVLEKQGLKLLQSCTDEATLAGVSTEFIQPSGNPGQTICNLASTWGADLIVVGRQGLSGWSELALGSVSNYVLHNAPCSVLTLQHISKMNTESAQDESSRVSASDT